MDYEEWSHGSWASHVPIFHLLCSPGSQQRGISLGSSCRWVS